jgi:hypothetical protein
MHIPFVYRVTAGLVVFAILLAVDLCRGRYQRAKEYTYLFGMTVAAMAYGIVHDYVSWSISPAYFVFGKGIASAATCYSWETVKLAATALWSVGLLGSACVLVANNADKQGRQLPYAVLVKVAVIPLFLSIAIEIPLGLSFHWIAPWMLSAAHLRSLYAHAGSSFFIVWGMHIGAYLGGAMGIIIAVLVVVRKKRSLPGVLPA